MGFVERHACKVRALLNRQVGRLLQQRKVAHHAGKRRAQVMRQVCDQIVFAVRLIAQGLLDLALAIAHAVERALDLQKVAIDVVPCVGVIDQAILNTGGKHAVSMPFALLIALVVQGAATKEQDAHGERQHKAEHVEHKAGIEQHRPLDAAECHGADRQRYSPRGTANHHAAANDFESIDQQKADE